MTTTAVGILGMGEAGLAVGAGLVQDAAVRVLAFDVGSKDPRRGDAMRAAAREAGIVLVEDVAEVAGASSLVLSFVTARAAEAVAVAVAPHLTSRHLYVDANSASPELMTTVAAVVEGRGADFADAAVMAAVPPHRHRVPMLVSGGGAARLCAVAPSLGMQLEMIDGPAGAASGVKMLRSLLVKGVEALLLQTGRAARQFGVFDQVLESMDDLPFDDWRVLADYLLGRTAVHGERRGHELEEVARTLSALSVDAGLAEAGARALLDAAETGRLATVADVDLPGSRHRVVAALEDRA